MYFLKGQSWNVTALEEDIISSIELTTPDVACKSYDTVNRLILLAESIENTEYGEFTQVCFYYNFFLNIRTYFKICFFKYPINEVDKLVSI